MGNGLQVQPFESAWAGILWRVDCTWNLLWRLGREFSGERATTRTFRVGSGGNFLASGLQVESLAAARAGISWRAECTLNFWCRLGGQVFGASVAMLEEPVLARLSGGREQLSNPRVNLR